MRTELEFNVIRCDCEEEYVGDLCPGCGARADELDDPVKRRRDMIDEARSSAPDPGPVPIVATPVDLWRPLSEWLSHFLEAVEGIAEQSEGAVAELAGSDSALERLRLSSEVSRYRPWLAIWNAVDTILEGLAQIREYYLNGLSASTPDEALQMGMAGQKEIDALATVAVEIDDRLARWNLIDEAEVGGEVGDIVSLASAAFSSSGADDLLGFERSGAGLYHRLGGQREEPPPGIGLTMQMLTIPVGVMLDADRFWHVARDAYSSVSGQPEALRAVAGDETWQEQFGEISQELRDSAIEAEALADTYSNRRLEIRSAVRLGHVLVERIAPALLRTFLAVRARRAYTSLAKRDIGSLLNQARGAGWDDWLYGLLLALRDADAHKSYRLRSGKIEFTSDRAEIEDASEDELVDLVLGGLESILAMEIAVLVAVAELDVPELDLGAIMSVDLSAEAKVELALSMSGWTYTDVDLSSDEAVVRGRVTGAPRLAMVVPLIRELPGSCDSLRAEVDGNPPRCFKGPLAPFRAWADADEEIEKETHWLEALRRWQVDGAQVLPLATVRKLVAVRVDEALALDAAIALRRLRIQLDLARRLNDQELSQTVSEVLTWRRIQASSGGHQPAPDNALRLLEDWAAAPISAPCAA